MDYSFKYVDLGKEMTCSYKFHAGYLYRWVPFPLYR